MQLIDLKLKKKIQMKYLLLRAEDKSHYVFIKDFHRFMYIKKV